MIRFLIRAFKEIFSNLFLNAVTMVTIAFSVLMVSAFLLFFVNVEAMVSAWIQDIRIMAYLRQDVSGDDISEIQFKLEAIEGVKAVRFVSREEAMEEFRTQLKHQASLVQNLKENPLPDAFEIQVLPEFQSWDKTETIAIKINALLPIEDVEYGQQWLERFTSIFKLFELAGYALAGLFFMASVFFVSNTIRLALYSRRDEIEIMQLVGASDGFITGPMYFKGMFQGLLGGAIGLSVLFFAFRLISSNITQTFSEIQVCFLPVNLQIGIVVVSMMTGWLGCYLSLRRFLKS
jgi:cell division transport system permease protein